VNASTPPPGGPADPSGAPDGQPSGLPAGAVPDRQPAVDLRRRSPLLDGFFRVEEAELRFERFSGGWSRPVQRMHLDRGRAAAVLLHHTGRRQFLLVAQFRFAAWTQGHGWLTEIVAGKIDDGETPEAAARREVEEETGYRPNALRSLGRCFTMPGGSSERIHLFYAPIDESRRVPDGGLAADPDEDLLPVWVDEADVLDGSACFRYPDAKTQIALLWYRSAALSGEAPVPA
jgi:ADP-ribose pyrophosphatase